MSATHAPSTPRRSCWGYWNVQVVKFADQGAQRLFCVIFGACCNTLLLIIFELLDFMTYTFRLAALKTHIAALLLFMLCAVPRCSPPLLKRLSLHTVESETQSPMWISHHALHHHRSPPLHASQRTPVVDLPRANWLSSASYSYLSLTCNRSRAPAEGREALPHGELNCTHTPDRLALLRGQRP